MRKAANLAIDRDGLKELLGGLMIPAKGFVPPGHPWFGHPTFDVKYDPEAAKKLLAEAGYGPHKPLKTKIADLGLGLRPDAAAADERVRPAEPRRGRHRGRFRGRRVEHADQHLARRRQGRHARGATAINYTYFIQDPFTGFIRHLQCNFAPPNGTNWGYTGIPTMDSCSTGRATPSTRPSRPRCCEKIHEKYRRRGAVPDGRARRQSARDEPKVKGFVQAQNWFQDFSPITIAK